MGGQEGGTWRTLRVPDRRHGGQGHSWCHGWCFFTLRKIPWKFHVDIFIRSVSRMGGPSWGYLEDIEGSWTETWRTWSSLMSWMILFYPQEDTLKVSCWYLYWKCVKNGGSRRGVLGGCWGFLTRDLEDRVILDLMYLVDPKDHILKISCHYLYFWLRYKHMSRLSQKVTYRHTYKHLANLYKIIQIQMKVSSNCVWPWLIK